VLGEEEPEAAGSTGRRWIVDPIDGTKAFTRGVPLYSTLLALDDEHGPALGVIVLPALGEVVYAGRGRGCWTATGQPARVSTTASVDGAYLMSSGYSHWPDEALLRQHAGMVLRTWGDGCKLRWWPRPADAMVDPTVERTTWQPCRSSWPRRAGTSPASTAVTAGPQQRRRQQADLAGCWHCWPRPVRSSRVTSASGTAAASTAMTPSAR
jgi:hypothetical protein